MKHEEQQRPPRVPESNFDRWWRDEGRDAAERIDGLAGVRRLCATAWDNGAFKAMENERIRSR